MSQRLSNDRERLDWVENQAGGIDMAPPLPRWYAGAAFFFGAIVLVFLLYVAAGCGPFVRTPEVVASSSRQITRPSLNDSAWHLVSYLSIAAMVAGVMVAVVPLPVRRPIRGLSIVAGGFLCLLMSNLMRQYEHVLTIISGVLAGVGFLLFLYYLWIHRRQLAADGLAGRLASGLSSSTSDFTPASANPLT